MRVSRSSLGAVGALGAASFSDVPEDHPFFDAVEWMKARGISLGCEAGPPARYCLDRPATRGEVAAFLYRMSNGGANAPVVDEPNTGIQIFGRSVSPYLVGGGLLLLLALAKS